MVVVLSVEEPQDLLDERGQLRGGEGRLEKAERASETACDSVIRVPGSRRERRI